MNWTKFSNNVFMLWNKRLWPECESKPMRSDDWVSVENYDPGARMLGAELQWQLALLFIRPLTPSLGGCAAAGPLTCMSPKLCEERITLLCCRKLFSTITFASQCNFVACTAVTDSSQHCCYSRLSRWERRKWLTTCRKLCLESSSLIVHLHLVNGSKQIKISWPLEAKAMPNASTISNPCRVEMFLIKCHRNKEISKNNKYGLEYTSKIKY